MKIRDEFSVINGDESIIEIQSNGVEIVADDGRALFVLRLLDDGDLEVSSYATCKHGGAILEEGFMIKPSSTNRVIVRKNKRG